MSRDTGRRIATEAHLAQSVRDILTTPVGSRVMRREYGSDLPALVDAPITGETLVDVYMATAEALDRWEPRLTLQRVAVAEARAGRLALRLDFETPIGAAAMDVELTP